MFGAVNGALTSETYYIKSFAVLLLICLCLIVGNIYKFKNRYILEENNDYFKNVSKTLGKHLVLDNINYTFENGMVYGLCGHNGSGKTMLLRAIAGLIVPDDGEIIIDGEKLHRDISFPPNAGIVIESMELLPKYNAFDNLRLLADIKKIASDEDIRNSLERVGLNSDLKVKKFSLGMKQRLNVAQAILKNRI